MPRAARHEVAGAPHASRPLVVAAGRVVERRLLEDVERERPLAPDAFRETGGERGRFAHAGRGAAASIRAFSRSASVIMSTRPGKVTRGVHPSSRAAFDASPSR